MGAFRPQNLPQQCNPPERNNHALELTDKKRINLRPTANELPRNLISRLGTYMYNQIRMANPSWKDEAWYPEKKQLYKKIKQSAMESWLNKTQITTTPMRTKETKTIHSMQRKEMLITMQKLQAQ